MLIRALHGPVYIGEDQKLSGNAIRGGYVFWVEDETAVHAAQRNLREANALLEEENSLIEAETRQREEAAYLTSRHRIYHEIAGEMYPDQKRIGQLLEEAEQMRTAPAEGRGEPQQGRTAPAKQQQDLSAFRDQIALISVLYAYVKRKTNLLLLAAEKEVLSNYELYMAIRESGSYLGLGGMKLSVEAPGERDLRARTLIDLYDTFEALAEQLLARASSLMVSFTDGGLLLAAAAEDAPDAAALPLAVTMKRQEEVLYMRIDAEGGAER